MTHPTVYYDAEEDEIYIKEGNRVQRGSYFFKGELIPNEPGFFYWTINKKDWALAVKIWRLVRLGKL